MEVDLNSQKRLKQTTLPDFYIIDIESYYS